MRRTKPKTSCSLEMDQGGDLMMFDNVVDLIDDCDRSNRAIDLVASKNKARTLSSCHDIARGIAGTGRSCAVGEMQSVGAHHCVLSAYQALFVANSSGATGSVCVHRETES